MDIYEEAVMGFVTRDQKTFVIPQFSIGTEGEWSCPDFVAIAPSTKECHVIEVSRSYDLNRLAQKVREKDNQWLNTLKVQLEESAITDTTWNYDVWVFIRGDRVEWFQNAVKDIPLVTIYGIETTLTPWNWK